MGAGLSRLSGHPVPAGHSLQACACGGDRTHSFTTISASERESNPPARALMRAAIGKFCHV